MPVHFGPIGPADIPLAAHREEYVIALRQNRAVTSSGAPSPHDDLDRLVRKSLAALPDGDPAPADPALLTLFDAMAGSRLLDIAARRMREQGRGYYTIGSAGHESNAFVAAALRPTDPALLHYRSGAFFLTRAMQAGRTLDDGLRAVLLGMLASTDDPASGGRHKVFGDASLAVIPQTSTIASHLPRALGVALSPSRARRLGVECRWPRDAVTVCSFGDASINHSTAAGALNAAGYVVAQGLPLPLLFVCEDNGIGISVASPQGWVASAAQRPGIEYLFADGADPDAARSVAAQAAETARRTRRPVLLHLRTVRYLSHAGSDVESAYRSAADDRRRPGPGSAASPSPGGSVRPSRPGATPRSPSAWKRSPQNSPALPRSPARPRSSSRWRRAGRRRASPSPGRTPARPPSPDGCPRTPVR